MYLLIEIISDMPDEIIEFLSREEINTAKKAKGKIKTINLKEYIHKINFEKTVSSAVIPTESPTVPIAETVS